MGKKGPKLSRWGTSMKLGLLIGSFLFGALGCIVMSIGIFLNVDQLSFVSEVFVTPLLGISSGLIAAAGVVVFLFSILGCFGVFLRNQQAVIIYLVCMSIVYLLASSGVALSIVFRSWVTEQLRSHMNEVLHQYYGINLNETRNQIITQSWDTAQQKWYCCGIDENGWGVYRGSSWFSIQPGSSDLANNPLVPLVPSSCCKKNQYGNYINQKKCQTWHSGPPYKQTSKTTNEAVFYPGCYERGSDELYSISMYLIIMGLVVAVMALTIVVASLFFAKMLE